MKTSIIMAEDIAVENISGQQKVKIINPTIDFKLPLIPSAFSFGIAIVISRSDFMAEHIAELSIMDPADPDVPVQTIHNMKMPKGVPGLNIIASISFRNVAFMHPGEYIAKATINGHVFEESFFITDARSLGASEG